MECVSYQGIPGIRCDIRWIEGYGKLVLEHDFNVFHLNVEEMAMKTIPISYIGFATDDELLALIGKSTRCEQEIEVNCPSAVNSTHWVSLTGDTFNLSKEKLLRYGNHINTHLLK